MRYVVVPYGQQYAVWDREGGYAGQNGDLRKGDYVRTQDTRVALYSRETAERMATQLG